MTFTPVQIATIRKIAEKYGVQEMEATEQKGIFLDAKTRIIINCKVTSKEKEFKGLPEIGITDMKGFTDENSGGQTVDDIRDDIRSALKALPREKSKPKVEHDSATQGQNYTAPAERPTVPLLDELKNKGKKDEPEIETKKADPIPETQGIKPFDANTHKELTSKDAIDMFRKEAIDEEQLKHRTKDESKATKAQDVSQTAQKTSEPEQAKPVKTVVCSECKIEISHKRALECMDMGERPICEDCFEKKEANNQIEPKVKEGKVMNETPKEPEKPKPKTDKEISDAIEAAQAAKKPKTALVIGTCEAVAIQYGIPKELANMFFMTLNDGLYIKNPGLLHLAAKKGYGRIEVETTYDEKNQEYESTCKVYPKITKELMEGISHLALEMQKTAWDYATAPTNGTGRASAKSVKMSTMQPFLKEMSQTRAQNRALRAYTGYGGNSLEELPEAEVKYIEG